MLPPCSPSAWPLRFLDSPPLVGTRLRAARLGFDLDAQFFCQERGHFRSVLRRELGNLLRELGQALIRLASKEFHARRNEFDARLHVILPSVSLPRVGCGRALLCP